MEFFDHLTEVSSFKLFSIFLFSNPASIVECGGFDVCLGAAELLLSINWCGVEGCCVWRDGWIREMGGGLFVAGFLGFEE